MPVKPKVVVLCGSSRFADVMAVVAWILERDEHVITMGLHLLPWWYGAFVGGHLAEQEGVACEIDELHLRKIDLADEVFVCDVGGYVGASTQREILHAGRKGLPTRFFSTDPVGRQVEAIHDAAVAADVAAQAARDQDNG